MMAVRIEPLRVPSLKEACILRLEELILSGEFKIGARLPAERDLAARLEVSRPVLHEALVDLGVKGLVQIIPRRGVYVSDFRRSGSPALLASLLKYHNGRLEPAFAQSLMDLRLLLETETARLAALNSTDEQLSALRAILRQESQTDINDAQTLTELDFSFHLQIAIASGNLVYPLVINSFQGVYTSLTGQFFRKFCGMPIIAEVFAFHARLLSALTSRQAKDAAEIMYQMLTHGEKALKGDRP